MERKSSWVRILLLVVVVGLLGLVGYIGYLYLYRGPEVELKEAESAYAEGVKALDSGNASAAVLRFQEANLKSGRTIELSEAVREKSKSQSAEKTAQLNEMQGKAFFLKARALRDEAYAAAGGGGHTTTDLE